MCARVLRGDMEEGCLVYVMSVTKEEKRCFNSQCFFLNVKRTYCRVHMPDRTIPSRWFCII